MARMRYPRSRQKEASSNLRRKAPSQSSSSRSSTSSSNIAARSLANERDGPPFMPAAPTCDAAPPSQRTTTEFSEEQMQRLIRELSNIRSNRSSRESGSSTNDYTIVPHISFVYEAISQIMMCQERTKHDMRILSERVLQHNEAMVGRIFEEINQLKTKVECFKDKAEWVISQMRSNESQTKNAQTSFDFWSSLATLTSMLEQYLASVPNQPAPQPFGSDYSHVHLRMPPSHSHHYRPPAPGRHAGSSSRPSVISSSDEE